VFTHPASTDWIAEISEPHHSNSNTKMQGQTDDDRSLHSNDPRWGDLEMADMESGRTGGGSSIEGSDVDESSMNSTKALKGKKGNTSGTEDEAYDVDMEGDDEYGDAAELSWKDLKVTSPDGKKVLLSEACGRVKGRFLAIMGPSGAGKVHHHLLHFKWLDPTRKSQHSHLRNGECRHQLITTGFLGLVLAEHGVRSLT
jgi:hypothetical protein